MASVPPDPRYLVRRTERPHNLRGFVFAGIAPPPDRAARRLARVQEPGRPGVKRKMTVRKSGIQARHLHISARKRSGLRHAGKFAYPVKPLNDESLDRPIRTHKKKSNHRAGVIVDVQFPCHSTPYAHLNRGQGAEPAVGSTVRQPATV